MVADRSASVMIQNTISFSDWYLENNRPPCAKAWSLDVRSSGHSSPQSPTLCRSKPRKVSSLVNCDNALGVATMCPSANLDV